jgi:hypothetical protein
VSRRRRAAVACASLLLVAAADAKPPVHEAHVERKAGRLTLGWSAVVALPVDEVRAALARHERGGRLLADIETFKVERREAGGAVLYLRQRAPLLMPDLWSRLRASVTDLPGGGFLLRWQQLEGAADHMERTWRCRPHKGGTQIVARSVTSVPGWLPDAMIGDTQAVIADDVARFWAVLHDRGPTRSRPPLSAAEP